MKQIDEVLYEMQSASAKIKRLLRRIFIRGKRDYDEVTEYSGSSFTFGKKEAISFIEDACPDRNIKILDVGPGRGIYNTLLRQRGYKYFDAVEIYFPYIEAFELKTMYQTVFHRSIVGFEYAYYDLVIMGDIIEHLRIKDAQKVIKYAQRHSRLVVVAVPYQLKQIGSQLDGSGDHRQSDLTREVFFERYPCFELLTENHQLGVFYYKRTDCGQRFNVKQYAIY